MTTPTGPTQQPVAAPAATPYRSVVLVALVIALPSLWMAYQGDVSLQTAVIRFIGALVVSAIGARLVLMVVGRYAAPAETPEGPATGAATGEGTDDTTTPGGPAA